MNRRLVVLTGLALLVLLGIYLSLGGPALTGQVPAGTLAIVNGHPLTASYVHKRIEQLPPGGQLDATEHRARFIESLVTEEVLFQMALAKGLERDPGLREKVKALAAEHLIEREVRPKIKVSAADIEGYYRANRALLRGETVPVHQILLATREECEALLPLIDSLSRFEALAREKSLDGASAKRGGALGSVSNQNARLGFEQQVFRMKDGELRIFDGPQGCHIVRAGARDTPPLPPLEEVRDRIEALLVRQQERELLHGLVRRFEADMPIRRLY